MGKKVTKKRSRKQDPLEAAVVLAQDAKQNMRANITFAFEQFVIHGKSYKECAEMIGVAPAYLRQVGAKHLWTSVRARFRETGKAVQQAAQLSLASKEQALGLLDSISNAEKRLQIAEQMVSALLGAAFAERERVPVRDDEGNEINELWVPKADPKQIGAILDLNAKIIEQLEKLSKVNKSGVQASLKRIEQYLSTLEIRRRRVLGELLNVTIEAPIEDQELEEGLASG